MLPNSTNALLVSLVSSNTLVPIYFYFRYVHTCSTLQEVMAARQGTRGHVVVTWTANLDHVPGLSFHVVRAFAGVDGNMLLFLDQPEVGCKPNLVTIFVSLVVAVCLNYYI